MKFAAGLLVLLLYSVVCPPCCQAKELLPWPAARAHVRVLRDLSYGPDSIKGSNRLDLYLPADFPRPLPLIVCIHGGGWSEGDKSMFAAFLLPSMGYAVACINYRLADQAKFPAQLDDCCTAIDWLISKHKMYGLDENRIGLWGGSAGGHLAALAALVYNNDEVHGHQGKIKAVCDWCGPTDLTTICKEYPAETTLWKQRMGQLVSNLLGADPEARPDLARAASPVTYSRTKGPPFLIMHGDHDPVVPVSQSKTFSEKLIASGTTCEFIVVPGGRHDFYTFQRERQVGEFFDRTVKSGNAPPTKKQRDSNLRIGLTK